MTRLTCILTCSLGNLAAWLGIVLLGCAMLISKCSCRLGHFLVSIVAIVLLVVATLVTSKVGWMGLEVTAR